VTFTGVPEEALVFYEGLEADNSKAYWSDHRSVYDTCVRDPLLALMAALEPEFGPAKLFRPYRDVRFSKDKTPYKTHAAFVTRDEAAGLLYLQLSADGLSVGGGYHHCTADQGARLRAAVADDRTGGALEAVLDPLSAEGWEVGGERYVRVPKPYAADAPRADLLRARSLTVFQRLEPAEWLHEPECLDRVAALWRAVGPLNDWLARHVGPPRDPVQR
jgi:uncharacterized protein (TIGR02453 family)